MDKWTILMILKIYICGGHFYWDNYKSLHVTQQDVARTWGTHQLNKWSKKGWNLTLHGYC